MDFTQEQISHIGKIVGHVVYRELRGATGSWKPVEWDVCADTVSAKVMDILKKEGVAYASGQE